MEIFLLVALIVIVLLFFSKTMSRQDELLNNIQQLRKEVIELQKFIWERQEPKKSKEEPSRPTTYAAPETIPVPKPKPVPPPVKEEEEFVRIPVQKEKEPVLQFTAPKPQAAQPKVIVKPSGPPRPSFLERNPDLEKFIGENLINKIGIAILVLGIAFFVKYAIDKEWINEYGRVGIGFLAGGVLVAIAHRLRKTFAAFSSVLIGGGMAVMYFTISIAFHDYHIFNQTSAFVLMVILTGFTIFLSYVYNRVELAVLAIIGGFTAPFLVSTGEGNYVVLFSYLLILNVGMLVLAYLKKWNIVTIVSYVFTVILYGGWLGTKVVDVPNAPYGGALLFATLFYLIFFLMNIINNVKEKRKFNVLEISLILSNTFLYFSAGMIILKNIQDGMFQGLFTVLIAIFNFIFVLFLFKKSETDRNLIYLLIGLVLTFISLAAPIQLEGNYITLFWAIESVLLLWLAQKSGIQLLKVSSSVILTLMVISLVMDWINIYGENVQGLMMVFNKGFITGLTCVVALIGNWILLERENSEFVFYTVESKGYKIVLLGLTGFITYIFLLLEVSYQANVFFENAPLIYLIIGLYNYLFLSAIGSYALKEKTRVLKGIGAGFSLIGLIGYLLFYQFQISVLRNDYLDHKIELPPFLFHYLVIALVVVVAFFLLKIIKQLFEQEAAPRRVYIYFLSFILILIASTELTHLVLLFGERNVANVDATVSTVTKIGFPILWGVCAFIFMFLGMRLKVKDLRIISLSLFAITLIKLFVFDLRNISEGGKIASFIILGVILLIISFMYQKVKALLVEEKPTDLNGSEIKEE